MFFHLLSRSPLKYISPHICTYSALLICAIHTSYLFCLESLAPRPNQPLPLVHLVTPELAKLLITSISLRPTLKDSLLFYLCLSLQVYVLLWRTLSSFLSTICDAHITKDQECPSVPPIQEQDITPLDISHCNIQRGFSAHPHHSHPQCPPNPLASGDNPPLVTQ